jgi:hypothetical protein
MWLRANVLIQCCCLCCRVKPHAQCAHQVCRAPQSFVPEFAALVLYSSEGCCPENRCLVWGLLLPGRDGLLESLCTRTSVLI